MTAAHPTAGATPAGTVPPDPADASTGELVGQLGEQLDRLVRAGAVAVKTAVAR